MYVEKIKSYQQAENVWTEVCDKLQNEFLAGFEKIQLTVIKTEMEELMDEFYAESILANTSFSL